MGHVCEQQVGYADINVQLSACVVCDVCDVCDLCDVHDLCLVTLLAVAVAAAVTEPRAPDLCRR